METVALQRAQLEGLRALVDRSLAQMLPDAGEPPHRLHAAMRYAALSPGKRIRPILSLLSASHLGCSPTVALPGACALELVHAASLVLDDLPCMDDADTRRGQPSVHARYGQDVAVLAGVALLNEAFGVISRAEELPESARVAMTALLARTVGTRGLIGGQDRDLQGAPSPSLGFVSQLHHEKTAVLFIACAEMGALAAGADSQTMAALRSFASELGLAFQAFDDLDDEDDLKTDPTINMLSVMEPARLRQEAAARLDRAKAMLAEAGPELALMSGYVDLLLHRSAA